MQALTRKRSRLINRKRPSISGGPRLEPFKLPVETDRQLDLARIVRRLDLPELGVEVEAVHRVLADRVVIIGGIEQVVELAAEREHAAFAEDLEALLDSEVHVHVVGTHKLVALAISNASCTRRGQDRAAVERERCNRTGSDRNATVADG